MNSELGMDFHLSKDVAESLTGGHWTGQPSEVTLNGATIDSRRVWSGALFACFQGAQVDGHDFASTAVGDGAGLILASRAVDVPAPVLVVDDVARALANLASEFRRRYVGATWIAISGANGKTTCKELLRSACGAAGPTHATSGNLNNHLGVPLTILNTPKGCQWVIVELGGNRGGEIDALGAIVRPDLAAMTSLGPAHLEGYGDLQGVAKGEAAVFRHVPEGASVFFGRYGLDEVAAAAGDNPEDLLAVIRSQAVGRQFVMIPEEGEDLSGRIAHDGCYLTTRDGEHHLALHGRHNLANAQLVLALAAAAGVDPAKSLRGLTRAEAVPGRLRLLRCGPHRIYDDCYNANPGSMVAGLEELSRQPGLRLAVLGVMGELGAQSEGMHRAVGAQAARLGVAVMVVGEAAAAIGDGYLRAGGRDLERVADVTTARGQVLERFRVGPTSALVKASHSAGLERLVQDLQVELQAEGGV